MAQKLDPEQWQKDLADGERRVGSRRIAERRRRDRWGRYIERGALLVLVILYVIGFARVGAQQDKLDRLVNEQKVGRAIAIDTLCGATSGVINAGRKTLLDSSTVGSQEFERHLVQMGFPPLAQRRAAAQVAAAAYGRAIARRVEQVTHHTGLTRPDGTIDCTRLKVASRATP